MSAHVSLAASSLTNLDNPLVVPNLHQRISGEAILSRQGGTPRLARAVVLAPLAAPLAVVLGSAVRALVSPRTAPEGISPVVSVLFLTAILTVYGAPLAYGATLVILWPAAAVLRDTRAFTWWTLTLVSTLAGGILFPVYLHTLDSRATWDFFPGAGFAAGAATGWVFWFIATRRGSAGS